MYPNAKIRASIFAGAIAVTCSIALVHSQYEWFNLRRNKKSSNDHSCKEEQPESSAPVGIAVRLVKTEENTRETKGNGFRHLVFQRSVREDPSSSLHSPRKKQGFPELWMIEICQMVDIPGDCGVPQANDMLADPPTSGGDEKESQVDQAQVISRERCQPSSHPQPKCMDSQIEPTPSTFRTASDELSIKEDKEDPQGSTGSYETAHRQRGSESFFCTACRVSLTSQRLQNLKHNACDPLSHSFPPDEEETPHSSQSAKPDMDPLPEHPASSMLVQTGAEYLGGDVKETQTLRKNPTVERIKSSAGSARNSTPVLREDEKGTALLQNPAHGDHNRRIQMQHTTNVSVGQPAPLQKTALPVNAGTEVSPKRPAHKQPTRRQNNANRPGNSARARVRRSKKKRALK